jgi:5-methyltetrahydrofolate--homocysteine methyltransferase
MLETITDLQELRAAIVGILSVVHLPLLVSLSFNEDLTAITGTTAAAFAVAAGFAGVQALGTNCGNSFVHTASLVQEMTRHSPLPVFCQPNAGLPEYHSGKTVYTIQPQEFAAALEDAYRAGAAIIGSCCGSTPDFTRELAARFKNRPVLRQELPDQTLLSSRTQTRSIRGRRLFIIGERINPSGRKKLLQELEDGHLGTVRADARAQDQAGCDAIDINVNIPHLAPALVEEIARTVQNATMLPLVIDSTSPAAVEAFAQNYAGKGLLNSVSGERSSLKRLLPLARKYHLAIVVAPLDERGVPATAAQRLHLAKKIAHRAKKMGIPASDIIFDALVTSAASEPEKVAVTLDTLRLLKWEFPSSPTVIGLSNISYGLPQRALLNSAFLSLAVAAGLDMVIANPLDSSLVDQITALNFLHSGDKNWLNEYIRRFSGTAAMDNNEKKGAARQLSLTEAIVEGDGETAQQAVTTLLASESAASIIDRHILPAMNEVGRRYQEKILFLPQLMAAADAVRAILPRLKEKLPHSGQGAAHRVMLATVQGDIHDIGKNLVASILESYNYTIIDLGKNVPAETVIVQARRQRVDIIGLSTLMTTTIPALESTVLEIKNQPQFERIPIFIGGAVITPKIAASLGVNYARDGIEMVGRLRQMAAGQKDVGENS